MFDLFGRRAIERRLSEITEQTARLSAAFESLAEAAAEQSTSKRKRQPRVGIGRFIRLVALTVVFFLGAVLTASYVPAAFTIPRSVPEPGNIEVLLSPTHPSSTKKSHSENFPIAINARYSEKQGDVKYQLWFPKKVAGQHFVIVLADSAVLADISLRRPERKRDRTIGLASAEESVETQVSDCSQEEFMVVREGGKTRVVVPFLVSAFPARRCQVIHGLVPSSTTPIPRRNECDLPTSNMQGFVPITLSGKTSYPEKVDWVHSVTKMPSFQRFTKGVPTDSYGGLKLGRMYAAPILGDACKLLVADQNQKMSEAHPDPSVSGSDDVLWSGEEALEVASVTSERRNGQALGNLALAGAGALAALSIGFIPIAYEASREWKLSRSAWRS